jgi:hypothetical protein
MKRSRETRFSSHALPPARSIVPRNLMAQGAEIARAAKNSFEFIYTSFLLNLAAGCPLRRVEIKTLRTAREVNR